jgi:hypothetical protein
MYRVGSSDSKTSRHHAAQTANLDRGRCSLCLETGLEGGGRESSVRLAAGIKVKINEIVGDGKHGIIEIINRS